MRFRRPWAIVLLTFTAGFLLQPSRATAQQEATYADEALKRLTPVLGQANAARFRMQPGISTIFGGWLAKGTGQGNEQWTPILVLTSADPNKEYRVIAAGDNDCQDLDVRVRVRNGAVVAQDTGTNPEAEVNFRPERQQDYVIEFRLYRSRDNCICFGAILNR